MVVFVFIVGIGIGLVFRALQPRRRPRQLSRVNDRLDIIDDMFLWGEVNNDGFYKGM